MIYEYALSPHLVAKWAIEGSGRIVGQFGMDQRRLVADFPKHWTGQVYGALYELFGDDDSSVEFQNARPVLDGFLQWLGEHCVCRTTTVPHGASWVDAALDEHTLRPFYAILANDAVDGQPAVITPAVIENIRDARWYLPTIEPSKKTAAEIASALKPLVARAREIVIVDPYFDAAASRFTDALEALLKVTMSHREDALGPPCIVLMTGVEQAHSARDGEFTNEQKRRVAENLVAKARVRLPAILPPGVEVELVCLAHPPGGDPLHNRFVMSDIGGAVMPYGIDASSPNAVDDLQPMQKGIYLSRWRQYARRQGIAIVRAGEMISSTVT